MLTNNSTKLKSKFLELLGWIFSLSSYWWHGLDLDVEVALWLVQGHLVGAHHVVVRLADDGDQEVEHHNHGEEGIQQPQQPGITDHQIGDPSVPSFDSSISIRSISVCFKQLPMLVYRSLVSSNWISEHHQNVHHVPWHPRVIFVVHLGSLDLEQETEQHSPSDENQQECCDFLAHLHQQFRNLTKSFINTHKVNDFGDRSKDHEWIGHDP